MNTSFLGNTDLRKKLTYNSITKNIENIDFIKKLTELPSFARDILGGLPCKMNKNTIIKKIDDNNSTHAHKSLKRQSEKSDTLKQP